MIKNKGILPRFLKKASPAQAIVLIAVAFAGLVAMVGLLTDGGMLLVQYSRLKRAVDAAAIGAAEQYRKGYNLDDLRNAAKEYLLMNQTNVTLSNITADTCQSQPGDPVLCQIPLRKLVRVSASQDVNFGFLRVLGFNSTTISATSIGEAASIDLMMVIDSSISMAAQTDYHNNGNSCSGLPYSDSNCANDINPGDDPSVCNLDNSCEPMADVKATAQAFADKLFYPYDRVSVITDTGQTPGGARDPIVVRKLQSELDSNPSITVAQAATDDQSSVDSAISGLKAFQPYICQYQPDPLNAGSCVLSPSNGPGPCLNYPPAAGDATCANGPTFAGQECPYYRLSSPNDPSTCNSTNAGGALLMAGNEFTANGGTDPDIKVRKDSFWAVILLLTGTPNSSFPSTADLASHPYGYCPSTMWGYPLCTQGKINYDIFPPTPQPTPWRHSSGDPNYSSLDYAMDIADWVANPKNGVGASIYTIGLGNRVEHSSTAGGTAQADEPERYMKYAAEYAGTADSAGDPSGANHGQYYYAPDTSGLTAIFDAIYQNITTRISE